MAEIRLGSVRSHGWMLAENRSADRAVFGFTAGFLLLPRTASTLQETFRSWAKPCGPARSVAPRCMGTPCRRFKRMRLRLSLGALPPAPVTQEVPLVAPPPSSHPAIVIQSPGKGPTRLGSERTRASRRTCRRGTLRRPYGRPRRNRSLKDRANECTAQIFVWPSPSGSIVECCALESHERIRPV
jgi:hypothetical protein